MTIQEAIERIEMYLYKGASRTAETDPEVMTRLTTAKGVLEAMKASSSEQGDLLVPQYLVALLYGSDSITVRQAEAIDRAVSEWRTVRDKDHSEKSGDETKMRPKKSMRKNPFFWIVFVFFIGMLIFSFVAAFLPEEIIPRWVSYVFSPVGAIGGCLQIVLSLREWRSDMKNDAENSKITGEAHSGVSIQIDDHSKHDDHSNHDDHSITTIVEGNLYAHKNDGALVVAFFVLACVALIIIASIAAIVSMGKERSMPQVPDSSIGKTQENPLIDLKGFDVIINGDGETVTVSINTQKEGTEIEFPSYVRQDDGKVYRVTAVGRAGLARNDKIEAVNLSTSIERIEAGAFANFSELKEIFIPDSTTYIGSDAFLGCTNLKTVNVDDLKVWYSLTFDGERSNPLSLNDDSTLMIAGKPITGELIVEGSGIIPARTFQNAAISQVTFESDVAEIGEHAFYHCTQLATVWNKCALNIEKGSTENGYAGYYAEHVYTVDKETGQIATDDGYLFDESGTPTLVGYSGATEQLALPDSTPHGLSYEIAEDAFRDHANITSIVIPDSVTSIGVGAFTGCSINEATMPMFAIPFIPKESLKRAVLTNGDSVDWGRFSHYSRLESVVLPDSVTKIGNVAFWGCTSLTSVTIPDGVTEIEWGAFKDCTSLASITIPDSVTSIGGGIFSGCKGLENLTVPYVGYSETNGVIDYDGEAEVERSIGYLFGALSYDGGIATDQSYLGKFISGNRMDEESLFHCIYYVPAALKNVTVIGGEICYGAFYGCSSLAKVTIGNGVTSIGEKAFYNCESLTSVTIPDSVTVIGQSAFYDCKALTSVTIGSSVTKIGAGAFHGCFKLIEVWDHSSLNIQKGSEENGGVEAYAKYVYTGNAESKQTVTDDGYIFYEDGEEIYLLGYTGKETQLALPTLSPSGKRYAIYEEAFYDCTSLTAIFISDGVTEIGVFAFWKCTSLERVTIPDSVTKISYLAFVGCTNLTIYCAAKEKPNGWDEDWNFGDRPVVWNYKAQS